MFANSTPNVSCAISVTSGFRSVQMIICKLCKNGCSTARFVRNTCDNLMHRPVSQSLLRVPGGSFASCSLCVLRLDHGADLVPKMHPLAPLIPVNSVLRLHLAHGICRNQAQILLPPPPSPLEARLLPLPRSRTLRRPIFLQLTSLAGETPNNERLLSGQTHLSWRSNLTEYFVPCAGSGCSSGRTVLTVHTHGCSIVENA